MEEITNLLSTEVICAIFTLLGVIYANIASRKISKNTLEKEIEKLERTWKHDETTTFEQAYREMIDAVSRYISDSSITNQNAARVKVALMMSFADGDLADVLSSLYLSLKHRPSPDAEEQMMSVISCRRELRIAQEKKKCFIIRWLKDHVCA